MSEANEVDEKNVSINGEYRYNLFKWKQRGLQERPAKDTTSQDMHMNSRSAVTEIRNFFYLTEHVDGLLSPLKGQVVLLKLQLLDG